MLPLSLIQFILFLASLLPSGPACNPPLARRFHQTFLEKKDKPRPSDLGETFSCFTVQPSRLATAGGITKAICGCLHCLTQTTCISRWKTACLCRVFRRSKASCSACLGGGCRYRQVRFAFSQPGILVIYDSNGREVFRQNTAGTAVELDVSTWANGIYWYSFHGKTGKFVIIN